MMLFSYVFLLLENICNYYRAVYVSMDALIMLLIFKLFINTFV